MPHAYSAAPLLTASLLAAAVASAQPRIALDLDDERQTYLGAGVSLPADLALLDGLSPAGRQRLFAATAGELDLGYIYERPTFHPADSGDYYARRLDYLSGVLAEAPGATVVLGLDRLPADLARDTVIDGATVQLVRDQTPAAHGEVAAWYHGVLATYAEAGVEVATVSLASGPRIPAAHLARLYHLAVDSLRARLADPARNPVGLPMPRVLAPEADGPIASADYLNHMRGQRPGAWANVSAVGFHQTVDGEASTAMENLAGIAGQRPLLVTRTVANEGDDLPGYDAFSRGHRGALSLAATFTTAMEAGVQSVAYDRLASREPGDQGGLVDLDANNVSLPLRHAAFAQLTATQSRGSRVVAHDFGTDFDFGLRVAAFRSEGGDTLVVHVANLSGTRVVGLDLAAAAGPDSFAVVRHIVTDSVFARGTIRNTVDTGMATSWSVTLPGFAVSTLTFAAPVVDTTAGGDTTSTSTSIVQPPTSPANALRVARVGTELYVSAADDETAPLRDVALLDLQGRIVAQAGTSSPDGVVAFELAGLARGVYVVTATRGSTRVGRRLVW